MPRRPRIRSRIFANAAAPAAQLSKRDETRASSSFFILAPKPSSTAWTDGEIVLSPIRGNRCFNSRRFAIVLCSVWSPPPFHGNQGEQSGLLRVERELFSVSCVVCEKKEPSLACDATGGAAG